MGDTYGVTPQGFVLKPLDQCLAELEALAKAKFGQGIRTDAASNWGQFLGLLAERESELWDMGQEIYVSRDPDQATGKSLESICAITGLKRAAATKSRIVGAQLGGVAGTVIAAGKVAAVVGTGRRFVTLAEVTLDGGGAAVVDLEAEDTGPVPAPAGTLTEIATPVVGWETVTNPTDALLGTDVETDAVLRRRREQTLGIAGSATSAAIAAEVALVATVAAVYENDDNVVVDGMDPHSVEVVVAGGTDAEIAAAIWRAKCAGIKTLGSTAAVVVDAAGKNHTVRFSRPEPLLAYLAVQVEVDAKYSTLDPPLDGDTLLKDAIAAWAARTLVAGATLYPRAIIPTVFGVTGVVNAPLIAAGLAPGPVAEDPLVATKRQIVQVDVSRITIVHV